MKKSSMRRHESFCCFCKDCPDCEVSFKMPPTYDGKNKILVGYCKILHHLVYNDTEPGENCKLTEVIVECG